MPNYFSESTFLKQWVQDGFAIVPWLSLRVTVYISCWFGGVGSLLIVWVLYFKDRGLLLYPSFFPFHCFYSAMEVTGNYQNFREKDSDVLIIKKFLFSFLLYFCVLSWSFQFFCAQNIFGINRLAQYSPKFLPWVLWTDFWVFFQQP